MQVITTLYSSAVFKLAKMVFGKGSLHCKRAFTMTELLVVVSIMSLLTAIVVPSVNNLMYSSSVTNSAYEIAAALQRARTYAMARNTYVWVGFCEEKAGMSLSGEEGKGRVFIAMVASLDGTKIVDESVESASIPSDRVVQLEKIIRLDNVHLADLGAPSGGDPATVAGRPDGAYIGTDGSEFRISSENEVKTPYPLTMQKYTFYQTVRFSPRGEVSVNGGTDLPRLGEIGLRPTRGEKVDDASPNVAVVQFSGVGGNVEIYRQ